MEKPLVFIIEDDPTQNQVFSISLKNEFRVETFLNGDTAATRLGEAIPDLVLLDLNLPGKSRSVQMNDWQMCRSYSRLPMNSKRIC